jgi:class 3 adenylate cyclase
VTATHEVASGSMTLVFTDVEQSTELLGRVGAERYSELIDEHRHIVRRAVAEHGGREVDSRGEEFFTVFARARDAVETALAIEREHECTSWGPDVRVRVRIGMHTGAPVAHEGGYLGLDVHRAARVCAAGHGGQVLLSRDTAELVAEWPTGAAARSLGAYRLKGIVEPEEILQLVASGLQESFPPLRVTGAERAVFVAEAGDALAEAARKSVSGHRSRRRLRPHLHHSSDDRVLAVAWEARAQIAEAPQGSRELLAQLATQLFDAARISADAERVQSSVDRKVLENRLRGYREMAVVSKRAQKEADALGARHKLLEEVDAQRKALMELAEEIEGRLFVGASADDPTRVHAHAEALARSLEKARASISPQDLKLAKTHHRGIYRRGRMYVVREFDEVGIEHDREFQSMHDALAHRNERDQESKARKTKLQGAPHDYPAMHRYMPVRDEKP